MFFILILPQRFVLPPDGPDVAAKKAEKRPAIKCLFTDDKEDPVWKKTRSSIISSNEIKQEQSAVKDENPVFGPPDLHSDGTSPNIVPDLKKETITASVDNNNDQNYDVTKKSKKKKPRKPLSFETQQIIKGLTTEDFKSKTNIMHIIQLVMQTQDSQGTTIDAHFERYNQVRIEYEDWSATNLSLLRLKKY